MLIPIKNSSNEAIEVQLEPWLDIVLLQPGETATLSAVSQGALENLIIEYDNRRSLLLHVGGNAKLSKAS